MEGRSQDRTPAIDMHYFGVGIIDTGSKDLRWSDQQSQPESDMTQQLATTTLTEFLLARIAEDEDAVRGYSFGGEPIPGDCWSPERVLAECEAKRRIVQELQRHERLIAANAEKHAEASRGGVKNQEQITALRTHGWELRGRRDALQMAADAHAATHADHPDFRDEWRHA